MKNHEEKRGDFFRYVEDRRVALIGGDDDISWDRVAECDVVVRINGHWSRQGGPCDVLWYSCADDLDLRMFDRPELYDTLRFAWVNAAGTLFNGQDQISRFMLVTELLKKENVEQLLYVLAPPRAWDDFATLREAGENYTWTKKLARQWNFLPLTGMAALYHLLEKTEAETVYVDGMNFYRKEDGSFPSTAGAHDIESQLRFFREMVAEHSKRIELSKKLVELL